MEVLLELLVVLEMGLIGDLSLIVFFYLGFGELELGFKLLDFEGFIRFILLELCVDFFTFLTLQTFYWFKR
jgi:hypothetical protein